MAAAEEGDGEMRRGAQPRRPLSGCSSGRSAAAGSPRGFPGPGLLPTEQRGRDGRDPPEPPKAPGDTPGRRRSSAPSAPRCRGGEDSPEKVIFAVEFPFPGEAFLGQVALALAALDAFDVPCPVQDVQ